MLSAASTDFHGFQVGVIGNLVHSSPNIKKEVLLAGALQPVIGLLRLVFLIFSLLVALFSVTMLLMCCNVK